MDEQERTLDVRDNKIQIILESLSGFFNYFELLYILYDKDKD